MRIDNLKCRRYYYKGIETNYVAMENGTVYNTKTKHYMTPYINTSGRYRVCLSINGYSKAIDVHKIIYEAFNGPVPEGMTINHIDENKLNNRPENLNLLTRSENIREYLSNNLDALSKKYSDECIHMVCKELSNGTYYRDIAFKYNIPIDYMYSIVKCKRRKKIVNNYLPFPESAYHVKESRDISHDYIDSLIFQNYSNKDIIDILGVVSDQGINALITRRRKVLNIKDPKYFDEEFISVIQTLVESGKSNIEIYKELGMEYNNRHAYLLSRIRAKTGIKDHNPNGVPYDTQNKILVDISNGMSNSEICSKYELERTQYVIHMLARLRQKYKNCGSETIQSIL